MNSLNDKHNHLARIIDGLERVIVALSGGVDSSLLLKVALDTLGQDNVLAVTCQSPLLPELDLDMAVKIARSTGAAHRIITTRDLEVEGIVSNPVDRCYYCRQNKLGAMVKIAREEGYHGVLEGSNQSDLGDYRPGLRAVKSFPEVHSPFLEAGLEKSEVRELARLLGLENWDRPAQACLASRVPYGETITAEKLEQVERAEAALLDMGFRNVRVRHHGIVARIELAPDELDQALFREVLRRISSSVKACGFTHVSLDVDGYRTGSLNERPAETT